MEAAIAIRASTLLLARVGGCPNAFLDISAAFLLSHLVYRPKQQQLSMYPLREDSHHKAWFTMALSITLRDFGEARDQIVQASRAWWKANGEEAAAAELGRLVEAYEKMIRECRAQAEARKESQ
jgi:hypothetical protein